MIRPISNILVPVDFSANTPLAISKALEYCPEQDRLPVIHLFHSQRIVLNQFSYLLTNALAGYTRQQLNADIRRSQEKLEEIRKEIQNKTAATIICSVSHGEIVQEAIVKKARQIEADLIIIGKKSSHSRCPFLNTLVPSKLASRVNIPVLTVKPGAYGKDIKNVVIPVGKHFPAAKLEILSVLNLKARPNIRLVLLPDSDMDNSRAKQLLLSTIQAFKNQLSLPVFFDMLEGSNKVKTLLTYCTQVAADVLIVYPGIETRLGKWTRSNISDLIPMQSRTQLLAVTPQ